MGVISGAVQGVHQPSKGRVILLLAAFLAPIIMGRVFLFKDGQDFLFTGTVNFGNEVEFIFGLKLDVSDLSVMLPVDLSGDLGGLNGNF